MQVVFDPMSHPYSICLLFFFAPHQTLVELASHPVYRALLRLIETKSQLKFYAFYHNITTRFDALTCGVTDLIKLYCEINMHEHQMVCRKIQYNLLKCLMSRVISVNISTAACQ